MLKFEKKIRRQKVKQRGVVIPCRRFGTAYWFIFRFQKVLLNILFLERWNDILPEKSARIYRSTLRNTKEERGSQEKLCRYGRPQELADRY